MNFRVFLHPFAWRSQRVRGDRGAALVGDTARLPVADFGDPGPLSLPRLDGEIDSRRIDRLVWAFVALGVIVRLSRYLMRFPLWGDEAFVAANFLDRGYADLLRPLDYHQVCPLLFLWVELTVVKLLGFSEWSLRLFPTLCSISGVFLFRHVASRLFRGVAQLLAVAIFAVGYYPIRHGGEVKAYAVDLLVALVLLALAIEWRRAPRRVGWLWALAAFAPLAVGLSLPAVFVAGGISLALVGLLWRSGDRRAWLAWGAYNVAVVASFLIMFVVSVAAQYEREFSAAMEACWNLAFPPLTHPIKLIVWLVEAHTGRMFAYPIGSKSGGSTVTFVCAALAIVVLWRTRRRGIVGLMLFPLGLALIAAALRRYPYGFSARTMQYVAPSICLMSGLGAATMIAWCSSPRRRQRITGGVLLLLAVIGVGSLVRDMVQPYKTIFDLKDREFARWLWTDKAYDAQLVDVKTDLGKNFFPGCYEWGHSSLYRCNQRIYSPDHRHGKRPVKWSAISADRPLRCVVFSTPEMRRDEATFQCWLDKMARNYQLVGRDEFLVNADSTWDHSRIEIYEFTPKSARTAKQTSRDVPRR